MVGNQTPGQTNHGGARGADPTPGTPGTGDPH